MGELVGNLRRFDVKTVRICEAVVIGLAVVVALVVSAAGGDGGSSPVAPEESKVVDEAGLIEAAAAAGQPLYWLGPRQGANEFEFTRKDGGEQTYVGYLPPTGAYSPGELLTVGTYRLPSAKQALRRAQGEEKGAMTISRRPQYEMLSGPRSRSAFVVFDSQPDTQVEVYSPKLGEAAALVAEGDLTRLK